MLTLKHRLSDNYTLELGAGIEQSRLHSDIRVFEFDPRAVEFRDRSLFLFVPENRSEIVRLSFRVVPINANLTINAER